MPTALDLIKRNPLFQQLSSEALETFIASGEARRIPAGGVLCQQGSPGDEVYLILEGRAVVRCARNPNEAPVDLIVLEPGETIGEMGFIEKGPRSATVLAESNLVVRAWQTEQLHLFCQQHPEIGYKLVSGIAQILCTRLRRTNLNVMILNKVLWGGA